VSDNRTGEGVQLDLSDVEHRVGKLIGGGQLWEPCAASDIRRWVMAMDYVNPLHWDKRFAENTKFGGIIAPQSMAVALDYGHGVAPACVGRIPGSHLIFGGEEWWWYGTHIRPGDHLTQERRFYDYKVTDTKFAGPTMFSRGDTVHRNQHGNLVAKARSTAIRYLAAEAEKRGMYASQLGEVKRWTQAEIAGIDRIRADWYLSNREGRSPHFEEVKVGDRLPRRVVGPHSVVSFANECRAHRQNIWGTWRWNPPAGYHDPAKDDAGFAKDMSYDHEARRIDPRMGDGLYHGPSSGHINAEKAENVGMGGAYGYGASMNAWFLDTIAYWAGHEGYIWHSRTQFRSPAFEGDVTYIDGEVVDRMEASPFGFPVVQVQVKMTTQDGDTILSGKAEVQLPY